MSATHPFHAEAQSLPDTEPLIRLNVESRGNEGLMRSKTAELLQLIGGEEAH